MILLEEMTGRLGMEAVNPPGGNKDNSYPRPLVATYMPWGMTTSSRMPLLLSVYAIHATHHTAPKRTKKKMQEQPVFVVFFKLCNVIYLNYDDSFELLSLSC